VQANNVVSFLLFYFILYIQTLQNKVLRNIINALWYIRNTNIHRVLKVDMVDTVIKKFAVSHEHRLHQHVNIEAIQLLDTQRRIKLAGGPWQKYF